MDIPSILFFPRQAPSNGDSSGGSDYGPSDGTLSSYINKPTPRNIPPVWVSTAGPGVVTAGPGVVTAGPGVETAGPGVLTAGLGGNDCRTRG